MKKPFLYTFRLRLLRWLFGPGLQDEIQLILNVAEEKRLQRAAQAVNVAALKVGAVGNPVVPADMNRYLEEPFDIDGCTIRINLRKDKWDMSVHAPGYEPTSFIGCISSYFSRPHGSAGIAVDTIIREGRGWKHMLPAMIRAERAYAADSGSNVT